MDDGADDAPTFDRAYLLKLLTEVRPDVTLEDFAHYANMPDKAFAAILAELQDAGEAAIYADGLNPPIVCLTPLGASRARVRISDSHPPIWLSVDGEVPPIIAVSESGLVSFTSFTDLDAQDGEPEHGRPRSFADRQTDPDALPPVEVLVAAEEFAEFLADGRRTPTHREFVLVGIRDAWPVRPAGRADRATPSASTYQEQFTTCPFCRTLAPGEVCAVCGGLAPGKPCPKCSGRRLGFFHYCAWCSRSGLDHLLGEATPPTVRRALKGGRGK